MQVELKNAYRHLFKENQYDTIIKTLKIQVERKNTGEDAIFPGLIIYPSFFIHAGIQ